MKSFAFGLILGLIAIPAAVFFYFRFGHPPVAVSDRPFPMERQIVHVPLQARIDDEMPQTTPIEPSETNYEAATHIYRQNCAACHGLYGHPSPFAERMYPTAPQLWAPHGQGVVGVSDDPPGETYWKIDNGIRLSGMPAFDKVLNQTQIWQVTLLLAHADQPLPTKALDVLKRPLDLDTLPLAPVQPSNDDSSSPATGNTPDKK